MAENPLLPTRKIKELHALMQRCRELERASGGKKKSPPREALLAASAIHLLPGDLVFAEADDTVAAALQPAARKPTRKSKSKAVPIETAAFHLPRLAAAAVAAQSLSPKAKNLVLVHTHENAIEPDWQDTLRFAQARKLPLLFLCTSIHPHPRLRASQKDNRNVFTWESVGSLCSRLRLPLLPVDGEDAVALYRVFQESSLHARAGAAPAIIWAMLHPTSVTLPRSQAPLARLKAYCSARNIKL